MRIVSGVQPTGSLHLGNYLGAIRQFIDLQGQGEALYFIADLHSLTTLRNPKEERALSRELALAMLALGVDPDRAILFRQSDVPEVLELYWILGTVVPLSNLERAHSYKDKVGRGLSADFGLFAYPVLMAADILLYGADVVPVGKDQIQHVEFARDWATKFNVAYVPRYDPADPSGERQGARGILKPPAARVLEETAVVPGVDGQKMSKSYGNTLDLFADEKTLKKKIMSIKTDSTPVEAPKPTSGSALYSLLELVAPKADFEQLSSSWRAGGKGYGDYKKALVDLFLQRFAPARARYAELMKDPSYVEAVLKQGAQRARTLAQVTQAAVRQAVGL